MLIHLEKLGKSFGEKVVLHDVSASVEKEDRIGIVGQNGAGKTTLLKILTGVYTDYDGEFSVTVSLGSQRYRDAVYLMLAASDADCTSFQGWDSSVSLFIVP